MTNRLPDLVIRIACALALFGLGAGAYAQNRETPYWATIKDDELNLRVGPSTDYRIEWVYKRKGMPLKVLRVAEGWRFVEDPDGDRGWVLASLLNAQRGAMVTGEGPVVMRATPDTDGKLLWKAEPGVVGKLGDCAKEWCSVDVDGRVGWIQSARLWGVD